MKTYLAYKNQIQGFEDVLETVKAMEKIAASSVHFLKEEVSNLNAYSGDLLKMLSRLSIFYRKKNHSLLSAKDGPAKKRIGKKALIVITGDKGLVGGLWYLVINAFLRKSSNYQSIITVGGKGKNNLEEEGIKIIKSFSQAADLPQPEEIKIITDYIFGEFAKNKFSEVNILYPEFISLAEQKPVFISFLPFKFSVEKELKEKLPKSAPGLPIFEPSKQKIFDELLKKYINVYFHKIVLEAKLSELSARTVAMENASAKTNDLIQKLDLTFKKERRRVFTQRQLESFTAHKV
jgi:F-type H+-transporting ATPase subunit gamma